MNQKYILLISAVLTLVLSALISAIPIWLYNQAEVSAMLPTLFTPDTFTFGIWSVIYVSFIALWIYEALWKTWISRENVYLLAAAQVLSSLWLIPSQYLWIGTSLIVMSWVLYLLSINIFSSQNEHKYFRYTLELFFGWILVAFIANIHLFLVDYGVYFFPEILTYISIALALWINVYFIIQKNIFIPSLVLIWACIGIISGQDNFMTQLLAWVSIVVILSLYTQRVLQLRK